MEQEVWEDLGSSTSSSAELVSAVCLFAYLWNKAKSFASALEYLTFVDEKVYVTAKQIL